MTEIADTDWIAPHWIAVDWGTSNLRASAMAADGAVLASDGSADGAGGLEPGQFETALMAVIAPWLDPARTTPVLICGMAGARGAWRMAPYVNLADGIDAVIDGALAVATDSRLTDVRILPGLCQIDPPDVIRGEETQLLGLLSADPGFDGLVILPGTHCKWVRVENGRPRSMLTMMTGELFDMLCRVSILRHSVGEGWDEAAFADSVTEAHRAPEVVMPALFRLRAGDLLGAGGDQGSRSARLSGLLIGLELRGAMPAAVDGRVVIIGADAISARYRSALAAIGIAAEFRDGAAMARAGLGLAHDKLFG